MQLITLVSFEMIVGSPYSVGGATLLEMRVLVISAVTMFGQEVQHFIIDLYGFFLFIYNLMCSIPLCKDSCVLHSVLAKFAGARNKYRETPFLPGYVNLLACITWSLLGPDVFFTTLTIFGPKKMEIIGKLCNEEPLVSIK
jgi:hypothetical protein